MHDQAAKLRKLVASDERRAPAADRPQRVILKGAKGGVGTTTIAINLAVALRKLDHHVLLIDAAQAGGDLATICDVPADCGLEDVLQSRCDWNAASVTGPMGISLVAQRDSQDETITTSIEQRVRQLSRKLDSGLSRYDFVLIDGGGGTLGTETLVRQCDACLLVSAPDHVAMKRSYLQLRQLSQVHGPRNLKTQLVINRVHDASIARDMAGRLAISSQRLLGFDLETYLINADSLLETNLSVRRPAVCIDANATVSQQVLQLAKQLIQRTSNNSSGSTALPTTSSDTQQNSLNSLGVA